MKKSKEKGFTILELIAAVAVFTIICISAISVIALGVKYNTINRETYNSDLISKAFIETIQTDSNRPEVQEKDAIGNLTKGLGDGIYITYLGDSSNNYNYTEEIESYAKTKFSRNLSLVSPINHPDTQFSALMAEAKTSAAGKKFAFVTKVRSMENGKLYEIENWCWDIKRGETSVINRKKIINSMM
ncbi:type II secretion system protein [Clostridium paraputrificum]|uniref:type II secretion system protein n=1 Tax=Clostridium paraputrificum TaxID=29363 RepID=UPI003D33039F